MSSSLFLKQYPQCSLGITFNCLWDGKQAVEQLMSCRQLLPGFVQNSAQHSYVVLILLSFPSVSLELRWCIYTTVLTQPQLNLCVDLLNIFPKDEFKLKIFVTVLWSYGSGEYCLLCCFSCLVRFYGISYAVLIKLSFPSVLLEPRWCIPTTRLTQRHLNLCVDLLNMFPKYEFKLNIFVAVCWSYSKQWISIEVPRGVMVIVVGNEHGDTSSNPGRDWSHFT